jgi:hypothetical protein
VLQVPPRPWLRGRCLPALSPPAVYAPACLPAPQDQYLELSTWLSPSAKLFGAGERASDTLLLK